MKIVTFIENMNLGFKGGCVCPAVRHCLQCLQSLQGLIWYWGRGWGAGCVCAQPSGTACKTSSASRFLDGTGVGAGEPVTGA